VGCRPKSSQTVCVKALSRATSDGPRQNEGTSFADDLATAEDYANFGRTNPARTGQSSYAVEVQSAIPQRGADSYLKAKEAVPLDQAQTVWRFDPSGGMVEVPLHSKNPWVRQWILQGLR